MTRLYRLDASAANIADAFGAPARSDPWQGGYVAPEKFAPVITAGRDFIAGPRPANRALEPRMVPRLWGVLPPPNSDDPTRRISTLRNADSPFWIGNLRNSEFRCLIPATAVMLWGRGIDYEGRRVKHWIGLEGAPVFGMLGVWKDEEIPAFAILTRPETGPAKRWGTGSFPLIAAPRSREAQSWLHGGWDSARQLIENPADPPLSEIDPPGS